MLHGELSSNCREVGALINRYKNLLKKCLRTYNIDHPKFAEIASNCLIWRQKINQASSIKSISHNLWRNRRKDCAAIIYLNTTAVFTVTKYVYVVLA